MIICHRYRFIFIKTRKTAGSSVEMALSRACSEGDVVTPLADRLGEEDVRRQEGGYGPAGWQKSIAEHRGFTEWKRLCLYGRRAPRFGEHATAAEIREMVPTTIWQDYFKFSLERNPWDRAVSRYYWQKYRWERKARAQAFPDVHAYLQWLEREKPHWISNWGHYAIGDELAVDDMLFYEDLRGGLERLRERLGIHEDISLPTRQAKSGFRPRGTTTEDELDQPSRDLITRLCAREIEAFDYREP